MSAASSAAPPPPLAPPPPPGALSLLGDRLEAVQAYADRLVDEGVRYGLLGPREPPRVWERHLLNCAVVQTLIPLDVRVLDVGTGAGLPGVVLALVRTDLEVVLVDSMLRRTEWLDRLVPALGLQDRVVVVRARIEGLARSWASPVVTARAVVPLPRLLDWCLPLVAPGGHLLALRGARASDEVRELSTLGRPTEETVELVQVGDRAVAEPTRVVRVGRTEGGCRAATRST